MKVYLAGPIKIVEGDLSDILSCQVVLANCWKPSYGTAMELVYARMLGVGAIVVVPDQGKVSPWLRYHAESIHGSLVSACAAVRKWIVGA